MGNRGFSEVKEISRRSQQLVTMSWHVMLYVTASGQTTSPVPCGDRTFQAGFGCALFDHPIKGEVGRARKPSDARGGGSRLSDISVWVADDYLPSTISMPARISSSDRRGSLPARSVS